MAHEGDERKSEAGKERSGKKIGIECSRGCNRTETLREARERESELERLRSRKQSENRKHETASSVLHRL